MLTIITLAAFVASIALIAALSDLYGRLAHQREVRAIEATRNARDLLIQSCSVKQRVLLRFFFRTGSLSKAQFQLNPIMLSFGVLASLIKAGYVIKLHDVYSLAPVYQF